PGTVEDVRDVLAAAHAQLVAVGLLDQSLLGRAPPPFGVEVGLHRLVHAGARVGGGGRLGGPGPARQEQRRHQQARPHSSQKLSPPSTVRLWVRRPRPRISCGSITSRASKRKAKWLVK